MRSTIPGLKRGSLGSNAYSFPARDCARKLEDVFGKGSEQPGRLKSSRFFDFTKHGPGVPPEAALREDERAQYLKGL